MADSSCNPQIIQLLSTKSSTKQYVYRQTVEIFKEFKNQLKKIAEELNDNICNVDASVVVDFVDRGAYEAEIRFSGDIIIFQMHTNVFTFEKTHGIWKNSYVREDSMRAYFGMINMYNFLTDSLKFNRLGDVGHLIGRIFVNRDQHFFVEGKRQFGYQFNNVAGDVLDPAKIREIVEMSVIYALDFDLTTPDFNSHRYITVQQIQMLSSDLRNSTSKKLGFKFKANIDTKGEKKS
ncbi:hypothetical protein [Phaeocystidibacter luteus]|uniref:Uncharacterized protein n=1 Tax=Phaeocystidibacter luteus TaxID=911197 RepID=A0A6N6RGP1_9FLAO|nr:hypothetical protein [Phaeocystidibacter luteus]KAB2808066.1 hypothetical protein F8C67_10875 [Phaeocystidibacter luteus]